MRPLFAALNPDGVALRCSGSGEDHFSNSCQAPVRHYTSWFNYAVSGERKHHEMGCIFSAPVGVFPANPTTRRATGVWL